MFLQNNRERAKKKKINIDETNFARPFLRKRIATNLIYFSLIEEKKMNIDIYINFFAAFIKMQNNAYYFPLN